MGGREESLLWLTRGRTKLFSTGARGRAVSRRCPGGVPSVSRRCPDDDDGDDDGDDDDGDGDGVPMMMMLMMILLLMMIMVSR